MADPIAELSLLVDAGSAWTKASVVGRARGRWRIVAHAAQPSSWGDEALHATLAARLAGGADQRLASHLAEIVAAAPRIRCHTPRRPGRLAIGAVAGHVAGAAVRHAAESAGWVVTASSATDDGRPLADRLAALSAAEVDVWVLAGGFDEARPDEGLEEASIVAAARGARRGPVVWAGPAALAAEVAGLFEPGAVTAVANPRPASESEDLVPLRRHLDWLLERLVSDGATTTLAPVGFRRAITELAREERLRVGGVDLGARYATWVAADGTREEATVEGRVYASGGYASPSLGTAQIAGRLARSMAAPLDELAVADALQNLRSRPTSVPNGDDERIVAGAAARVLLTMLASAEHIGPIDLLVGAGRVIAGAPTPAMAMQLLLDGMRPVGVTQLAIDPTGALPPLGSLADDEISEAIGTLRDDLLVPLGSAVVTRGGRGGHLAMRVSIHRAGWPTIGPLEVRTGQLTVVPLRRGERADLEIEVEDGVSLGAARGARRSRAQVSGGAVGLVLDARDTPMALPKRVDDRRAILAAWRDVILHEAVMPATAASS